MKRALAQCEGGHPRALALSALLGLVVLQAGCRAARRDERGEATPALTAATPATSASLQERKPLIVLEQRDDRDVVSAESFVTAHRTVVLLGFRQPNRHRQAGQALVLDTHDEVVSSRFLPARADEGEGAVRPALRYLDDASDRTDGIVVDLVPETDPLGGAMVGNVHTLGRGAGLSTKTMPPPPRGTRWAGPTLAWAAEGELLVLVRTSEGREEQVFTPFAPLANERGPRSVRAPKEDERKPLVTARGPAVDTETRCDDQGCRTSVWLVLGDRRRAALQGKASGSLQQRTPVE